MQLIVSKLEGRITTIYYLFIIYFSCVAELLKTMPKVFLKATPQDSFTLCSRIMWGWVGILQNF